jgi:hypothetical protein
LILEKDLVPYETSNIPTGDHIVGNFPNLALQGGALLHTGHGVIPVLRRLIGINN